MDTFEKRKNNAVAFGLQDIDSILDDVTLDNEDNLDIDSLSFDDLLQEEKISKANTVEEILEGYKGVKIFTPQDLDEPYRQLLYTKSEGLVKPAHDVELYTRLKQEILSCPDEFGYDIECFEKYRASPPGSFKERGMFFSDSLIELLDRFPYLRDSSAVDIRIDYNVFDQRYIYYITLPSGDVYTVMGYSYLSNTDRNIPKYQEGGFQWAVQSEMVGNLESLSMYDGGDIYVCEGYFDALCINTEWGKKSIANLGSTVSKVKRKIYNKLKDMGHMLILVRDMDIAGQKLANDPIWDRVYSIPMKNCKDVDDYRREFYLDKLFKTEEEKNTYIDKGIDIFQQRFDVPFYNVTLEDRMLISRRQKYGNDFIIRGL